MKLRFRAAAACAAAALTAAPAAAQLRAKPDTVAEPPANHAALDLTAGGVGVSLGNSRRVTGVRVNLVDHQVERVNGLNVTLWIPKSNPDFVVNGAAVGLVFPRARTIDGVAVGGLGIDARELNGIGASGIATIATLTPANRSPKNNRRV